MRSTVHALVPLAVLLLTAAAFASALQPASIDSGTPLSSGGVLSARGLWADARGNTVLVSERFADAPLDGPPSVELRFFDATGRTAWMLTLGEGLVTSLVEDGELLYLALARSGSATDVRTVLMAVSTASGQIRWTQTLDGEITDLLADGVGGLRARSLREAVEGRAPEEYLLSLRDGVLLWEVALNP
jgi:hypothetical protein